MFNIKVKYHDSEIDKLVQKEGSDWIDLRAAETVTIKKGEIATVSLGVSMQLPQGYEAHVVPRSSTYKTWKILQTNSFGVIDESYCGDNDIWKFQCIATEDTTIEKNSRICQFRIEKKQPQVTFEEVGSLNNEDRGGFGSTGVN